MVQRRHLRFSAVAVRLHREAEKIAAEASARPVEAVPKPLRPGLSAEEKRRRLRLKEVESQIAELEARLAALSRQLENPPPELAKVQRLGGEYVQVQNTLEALMQEWDLLTSPNPAS